VSEAKIQQYRRVYAGIRALAVKRGVWSKHFDMTVVSTLRERFHWQPVTDPGLWCKVAGEVAEDVYCVSPKLILECYKVNGHALVS